MTPKPRADEPRWPEPASGTGGPAASSNQARPDTENPRVAGAEVGSWLAADMAASHFETLAAQSASEAHAQSELALAAARRLLELGTSEERLNSLVDRWGATDTGQLAGRLHELWHEATYNMSAAAADSPTRVWMTELGGPGVPADPHATSDLSAVAGDGTQLADIQAKAVASTAERIRQLSDEKYGGMQLLVPTDHLNDTTDLIDRRIAQADPGFLKRGAYEDASSRLTDRIQVDGLESEPASSGMLRSAASDPRSTLRPLHERENEHLAEAQAELDRAQSAEVQAELAGMGAAALASGVTGAAIGALVSAARNSAAVRAGRMSPTAAAVSAVGDAATSFARSMYVGGIGQGLSVASAHDLLPEALGTGTLPFALARASLDLGVVGYRYASGQLSGPEAAAASARSMTSASFVWAASVVGQAAIPVPVVGALVGGMVGSLCSGLAIQGLTLMGTLAREAHDEWEALARLEVEIAATMIVLEEERRIVEAVSRTHELRFAQVICPALETLEVAIREGRVDEALDATSRLIIAHGREPLFSTVAEFQIWMNDPLTRLVLDPNPSSQKRADSRAATHRKLAGGQVNHPGHPELHRD